MAKYCSKECKEIGVICDFCKYYDYNGEDLIENGITFPGAIYVGKGYCNYHKIKQNPEAGCNNYICCSYNLKEKK